jgi:uncharacterized protein
LNDAEVATMLKRFPFLRSSTVAPATYRGQTRPIQSVAAWNFVMAHKDLPELDAYFITKTVLSAANPQAIAPSAEPTRAANAPNNQVVPFHPGALRYYKELNIQSLK